VNGKRLTVVWPPGYYWFRFLEDENAVGVFPKPGSGNPLSPFVIDGFHGYYNEEEDICVYRTLKGFFRRWYLDTSESNYNPNRVPRKPPGPSVRPPSFNPYSPFG